MSVQCEHPECKKRFDPTLGHLRCPSHSACVTPDWIYDPCRCQPCIDFFNSSFVGATSMERVSSAKILLASFIRKIRNAGSKLGKTLRVTSLVSGIRARKQKLAHFTNMLPLSLGAQASPHTMSDSSSSEATPSIASGSSRASSVASANSEYWKARFQQASSVLDLHGLSVDNPVANPSIPASEPISEVVIRPSSLNVDRTHIGFSSLPSAPIITVVSSVSSSSSCVTMPVFSSLRTRFLHADICSARKSRATHTKAYRARTLPIRNHIN